MKNLKVGSDFSGVGAFDQALKRLGINYETIFACDMDKYARRTFIENYGEPKYYPENVYDREIPKESIDIYMTSPPCQAFSIAGKRKGETEERGVLFYNSHEFIIKNKPRYFIFENVKGLLSDDNGRTFQRWVDYLSKSVNGQPVIFPHEESANYHVYYQVLNSKDYGVPQNRERIFIVGIRDDADNNFTFPPKEHLTKRLKDILEDDVDEKYFLSEKMINYIGKDRQGNENLVLNREIANTITCEVKKMQRSSQDNYIEEKLKCKYELDTCVNSHNYFYDKKICKHCTEKDQYEHISNYESIIDNINNSKVNILNTPKIRRLTPRECFRLQDFPESFKMPCSDSQMYKQAGNSITVGVLEKIIKRLIKI